MYDSDDEEVGAMIAEAGDAAIRWARNLLKHPDTWVILDTETTGLDRGAEIIQIAIIDPTGKVLLDQLVKPMVEIEPGAYKAHGIGMEMLNDKPDFREIADQIAQLLEGKKVITYNAAFDSRLLWQTCYRRNLKIDPFHFIWECAMLQYAAYWGDWSSYHGSFRWQALRGGDHTAAGDCRATLAWIQKMAASELSTEQKPTREEDQPSQN